MVIKRKIPLKTYALTYHPKKDNWSFKIIKKRPKKVGRNTTIIKGKSSSDAWKKMSTRSYQRETGKK